MCGRYTIQHSQADITGRFEVQTVLFETAERYNVAPTQVVPVVLQEGEGRTLDGFRWGLVPFWARDPEIGNRLINARAETLADKPAFKHALARRRCLIPADGFYEWKREGDRRQPVRIQRRDGGLFAFAGLWDEWNSPDGTQLHTCTIITVPPNRLVSEIHDRMPAILSDADEDEWLRGAAKRPADLLALLRPYAEDALAAYPVGRQVNSPAYDRADCIAPLTEA